MNENFYLRQIIFCIKSIPILVEECAALSYSLNIKFETELGASVLISLEERNEIFVRRFIKAQKYRRIARDLDLNRGTVTKACDEITKKIKEMNLDKEVDLSKYIDKLVVEPKPKRKVRVVRPITKSIIKNLVRDNEVRRTRGLGDVKKLVELYEEFRKQTKYDDNGENILGTDITYNRFYKLVRKIKEEIEL